MNFDPEWRVAVTTTAPWTPLFVFLRESPRREGRCASIEVMGVLPPSSQGLHLKRLRNKSRGVCLKVPQGSLKDTFCNHLKHVAFSTKIIYKAMFRCKAPCSNGRASVLGTPGHQFHHVLRPTLTVEWPPAPSIQASKSPRVQEQSLSFSSLEPKANPPFPGPLGPLSFFLASEEPFAAAEAAIAKVHSYDLPMIIYDLPEADASHRHWTLGIQAARVARAAYD